ncbi:MAG: GDP-mannose 4,6-dehydratase [Candidatus Omnitrophica bacterium]|nr:GDP-mannose 4,6-dehydratase [Candidatus Omnitrophota bacterium]
MKPLAESKILVTGAGGFIGSHLAEKLASLSPGVTALIHYDSRPHWGNLEYAPGGVKRSLNVEAGDITDPHFMRHIVQDKDIVFHLAALIAIPYSYVAPSAYFHTNVLGTLNLLEACRRENVARLICTSTSECYGTALTVPISEEHPLQAQSPYSASKIGADKAVESYYRSFDLPVVTIRPFNTYGARQSARAIIPTIVTQALSDSHTIRLGSLTPKRDLTYVSDTVDGFIAAAEAGGIEGETINLGVGSTISIGGLAEKIIQLTGVQKEIVCDQNRIRPEKSEVMHLISDNRKARDLMNWSPKIDLDAGLAKVIEFIQANPDFYKADQYTL